MSKPLIASDNQPRGSSDKLRIKNEQPAWLTQQARPATSIASPLKLLLVKPYQKISAPTYSPPLGLLYIVSNLRRVLGNQVEIRVLDMKLSNWGPEQIDGVLKEFDPDVVGFSALNYEAYAGHCIAERVKNFNPSIITAFGGPYALKNAKPILEDRHIDWVFEGSADRSFPEALLRKVKGEQPGGDIPGMSFRRPDGSVFLSAAQDQINELDVLPPPAWDLIDFDAYAQKINMAHNLRSKRYAMLFTSRGCPYLCNYCHDLFSKKFVYHSVDYVIAEIEQLYERYGVTEFQIVDDIFNLHKPRLKAIMATVQQRWPGKMKFTFPNGLRADILDEDVINALADAGTYMVCVAIESVTPRIQTLVEKHLDIEKTKKAIALMQKRDIQVNGFFMLGFPTETQEEIQATIDFAVDSDLTMAHFFLVVPQPGTPIYDLAVKERADSAILLNEMSSDVYRNASSWYEKAYGYPLAKKMRMANVRFYFSFRRGFRLFRQLGIKNFVRDLLTFTRMLLNL